MAIVGEWVPLDRSVLAGMAALLDPDERWRAQDLRIAIARVVQLDGRSDRTGAALAVNERGEVAGSVTGGPADEVVVAEALSVLRLGRPRLVSFRHREHPVFSHGVLHVFLEPLDW